MKKFFNLMHFTALFLILLFAPLNLFSQTDIISDVAAFSVDKNEEKYVRINYTLNSSTVVQISKIELTDEFGEVTVLQSTDLADDIEGDIGFVETTGSETKSFKWWFLETLADRKLEGKFKVKVSLTNKATTPSQVNLVLSGYSNGQFRDQTNPVIMKNITGPFTQFTPASGLSATGNWYNQVESGAAFYSGGIVNDFPYYNHASPNFAGKPTLPSGSSFIAIKDISANVRHVWVCLAAGKMQGVQGSQKLWDFQIHFTGSDESSSTATLGQGQENSPDLISPTTCNATITVTYVQSKIVKSDVVDIEKKPGFVITVNPERNYVMEPAKPGEEIKFDLAVQEPDGSGGLKASSGATVYLFNGIQGDDKFNALTTLTDAGGSLTYIYKVPDDAKPYSFYLKFYAHKPGSIYDKSGKEELTVVVEAIADLNVIVKPQRLKMKPEETTEIEIIVSDAKGAVADANVTYINAMIDPTNSINLGNTNSKGSIRCTVNVAKEQADGTYDLSFYAARGSSLDKKSGPTICKVVVGTLPELSITITPAVSFKLQPTQSQKIKIQIKDISTNKPVQDAEVYLIDPLNDDTKYNKLPNTDVDGIVNYDIIVKKDAKQKDYFIKLYAKKDKFIEAETTNVQVTVNSDPCWTQGLLEFCAEGGWETGDGTPTYTCSKKVTINNLIIFTGSMTIDTAKLSISAEGKFYVEGVTLPGGGEGNITISEGKFDLSLLGSNGKITQFLKSKVQNFSICGVTFDLTDLELVGGRSADGIKISGSIKVPFLSKFCDAAGEESDVTGIELTGLILGRRSGFYLSQGIKITNIGAGPSLCVKEISVFYDNINDRLSLGGEVMLPFCDVGGGGAIEKGALDSIGFMYKAATPGVGIPLGHPSVCAIGVKGSVNGISKPPLNIKLGAIIADCPTKALYEGTASLLFKAPSTLGGEIEGSLLKIPGLDFWQTTFRSKITYDWKAAVLRTEGEVHSGTLNGSAYFLNASGWNAVQLVKWKFVGEVQGDLTIPDISEQGYPWDYLASRLMGGLPVTLASAKARYLFDLFGPQKYIFINLNLPIKLGESTKLAIELDFTKTPNQPGFFYYRFGEEALFIAPDVKVNPHLLADVNYPFTVPSNINFTVATIKAGTSVLPVSKIQKPDGTIIDKTTPDSSIIYSELKNKAKGFWTLNQPIPGDWKLILVNPAPNDSVKVYAERNEKNINIQVLQNGLQVEVSWNGDDFNPDDSIHLSLDDNNFGLDGSELATLPASAKKYSFTIPDSLNYCSMYVSAMVAEKGIPKQSAYSTDKIVNPKSDLPAPSGINAFYNTATRKVTIYWTPVSASRVESYYIIVTDKSGHDSVYAGIFKYKKEIVLEIEDYQNKTISMISVDANSVGGCVSNQISIATGLEEEFNPTRSDFADISIVPNPSSNTVNIIFRLNENSFVNLSIFDVLGNRLMDVEKAYYLQGSNSISADLDELASGNYILRLQTISGTIAKVLIKK